MNSDTGIKDYVGIRKGLGSHSLGELEAQIMNIVWDLDPPVTAAQVFKVMYPLRELSYSTIMLTMTKLSTKGLLDQTRSGPRRTDAFRYAPTVTREQLGRTLLEGVCERVFGKPLVQALKEIAK